MIRVVQCNVRTILVEVGLIHEDVLRPKNHSHSKNATEILGQYCLRSQYYSPPRVDRTNLAYVPDPL
jgi:hypothetical protein